MKSAILLPYSECPLCVHVHAFAMGAEESIAPHIVMFLVLGALNGARGQAGAVFEGLCRKHQRACFTAVGVLASGGGESIADLMEELGASRPTDEAIQQIEEAVEKVWRSDP